MSSASTGVAWLAGVLGALAVTLALVVPGIVRAHDSAPGVLGLEEQEDGSYLVAWTAPVDTRIPSATALVPRFPSHCTVSGPRLECGARGLEGTLAVDGLVGRMRVAVIVVPRDAAPREDVLDATHTSMQLEHVGSALTSWIALGAEHVLLGLDHLAFLLGLLFVSRLDRSLVVTITAFTVAHSITLALAVLEVVRPSSALVEALIALSVLLVAREGLVDRDAAPRAWSVRRAPAAIAAFFGLVHGLGLAGALREAALPARAIVPALFGFNLGVELGQLAFVAVAVLLAHLARGASWAPHARTVLVYAVGCAAAYWLVVRTAAIVLRIA